MLPTVIVDGMNPGTDGTRELDTKYGDRIKIWRTIKAYMMLINKGILTFRNVYNLGGILP